MPIWRRGRAASGLEVAYFNHMRLSSSAMGLALGGCPRQSLAPKIAVPAYPGILLINALDIS